MKKDEVTNTDGHDEQAGDERRPYEPPAVLEEAEFETLAMACGKLAGTIACRGRPVQS